MFVKGSKKAPIGNRMWTGGWFSKFELQDLKTQTCSHRKSSKSPKLFCFVVLFLLNGVKGHFSSASGWARTAAFYFFVPLPKPPCRGFVPRSLHEWSKIFWWWNNLRKRSQRLCWVGARKKLNEWNERSSVMMTECQAFKVFQKSSSSSFSPTLKFFERMQKSKKLLFGWKPTRTELQILNLKCFGVLTFDDLCENWQVF